MAINNILNVNGLNIPTVKHTVAEWIKKDKTHLYAAKKKDSL